MIFKDDATGGPNQVALSSPMESTGVFELDPQSEILKPFEGIGVDTSWEFRMPKPSNPIDYRSIADVIITLEYTALNSYDFKQQVIESLSSQISADRAFSFKQGFPDQWIGWDGPLATKSRAERGRLVWNISLNWKNLFWSE